MLTKEQIINLAKKQEWWNEFDKKKTAFRRGFSSPCFKNGAL